jgi:hypothetical protein
MKIFLLKSLHAAALWSSAGLSRQTRRKERPNDSELRNIAPLLLVDFT